ncbi:MAG TPA: hypothetical protein VMT98_17505 [Verrucomicrobiae bacterium]|nr:hypothetical protein [Verrucomicrobiae bacterium]
MAKLPDNRRPFDPAKAMRERNQQREAERVAALAAEPVKKKVHRHGLRPLPIAGDREN